MFRHLGMLGFYILHESRTAGGCEKALFLKLKTFLVCHHLCAYCNLQHLIEAQLFYSCNNLSQICIKELAGDSGSNDCYHLASFTFVFCFLYFLDDAHYAGHINCSAERTLVHAGSAVYTLVLIYGSFSAGSHGNSSHLTCSFAGSLEIMYGSVRAVFGAFAAFHTLALVYGSTLVFVYGYGITLTCLTAAVGKASPAEIRHHISCLGTFITGNFDYLNYISVVAAASEGKSDSLSNHRSVLVYAAGLRGLVLWNHLAGYFVEFRKGIVSLPCLICNLSQHLIFRFLNLIVKKLQFQILLPIYMILHDTKFLSSLQPRIHNKQL